MCVSVGGVSAVDSVWETCVCVCVCVGGVTCAACAHLTSFISACQRPAVLNSWGLSPHINLFSAVFFFQPCPRSDVPPGLPRPPPTLHLHKKNKTKNHKGSITCDFQ